MTRACVWFIDKEKKIPLRKYCLYNGLSYQNVMYKLRTINGKNMDEVDKVNLAVKMEEEKLKNQFPPAIEDYIVTMCKDNNLDENIVRGYMFRNRNMEIPINKLATKAVRYALDHKYFIGTLAVDDICEDMGYDKERVRKDIDKRIAKHPDLSKKFIIDQCLSEYEILYGEKFMIDGLCIADVCKKEHINPMYLVSQYRRKFKDLDNVDPEKLKKLLFDIINNKRPKFFEPTLDDIPLSYICEMHNYDEELMEAFMYGATISAPWLTDEDRIQKAIEQYEYVNENNVCLEEYAFKGLKETDNISKRLFYTKLLRIDDKCINEINKIGFNYYQTVAMIWFFGNKRKLYSDNKKRLFITDSLQRSIFSTITCLDKGIRSYEELGLSLAYRLYKCEVLQDNDKLLEAQTGFVDKIIDRISAKHVVPVGYDNSRTKHRLKCLELLKEAMDNCFSRKENEFIPYITKYVIDGYEDYLKSYKKALTKRNKNKDKNKKEQ